MLKAVFVKGSEISSFIFRVYSRNFAPNLLKNCIFTPILRVSDFCPISALYFTSLKSTFEFSFSTDRLSFIIVWSDLSWRWITIRFVILILCSFTWGYAFLAKGTFLNVRNWGFFIFPVWVYFKVDKIIGVELNLFIFAPEVRITTLWSFLLVFLFELHTLLFPMRFSDPSSQTTYNCFKFTVFSSWGFYFLPLVFLYLWQGIRF